MLTNSQTQTTPLAQNSPKSPNLHFAHTSGSNIMTTSLNSTQLQNHINTSSSSILVNNVHSPLSNSNINNNNQNFDNLNFSNSLLSQQNQTPVLTSLSSTSLVVSTISSQGGGGNTRKCEVKLNAMPLVFSELKFLLNFIKKL